MLQTNANRDAFGGNLHFMTEKPLVDVAGGMAGGQDDRTVEFLAFHMTAFCVVDGLFCLDTFHFTVVDQQAGHLCLKPHLAATVYDGLPHRLYHAGQLVRADMGMGVNQDGRGGAMLAEHLKYLFHVSAFFAAGE